MATFSSALKVLCVVFALFGATAYETDDFGGVRPGHGHLDNVSRHSRKLLKGENNPAALIRAASSGDTELVEVIIASGVPVDAINPIGWTALTAACTANHLETVEVLIDAGADIDHEAAGGITPLMAASTEGNLEVIAVLLESGADQDIEAAGKTALDMVCSCTSHVIGLVFRHCNANQCENAEDIVNLFNLAK